jgi:hypothetical protein
VRLRKQLNWFRATFSQIFDSALSIESGRLFAASSWSPSFKSGIISAIFQDSGYVEVVNELLMMPVNGPSMTWRQCLIIRMLILSGPGDLFDGIDVIMCWISVHVTGVNLNNSVEEISDLLFRGSNSVGTFKLFCRANISAVSAVLFPTD